MTYKFTIILFFIVGVASCKDDCDDPVPEEPYETEIQQFYLQEGGNTEEGICGNVLVTNDSALSGRVYYKPIDIPSGMITSPSYRYKGRFKVFPEEHTCIAGWVDPYPGKIPYKTMKFVTILEWEEL